MVAVPARVAIWLERARSMTDRALMALGERGCSRYFRLEAAMIAASVRRVRIDRG